MSWPQWTLCEDVGWGAEPKYTPRQGQNKRQLRGWAAHIPRAQLVEKLVEGPYRPSMFLSTLLPTLWPNSKPACAHSSVHRPGAYIDHTWLHTLSFQAVFKEGKTSSILEESKAGRP